MPSLKHIKALMITEMAEEDSGRPVVKFERYPSNHFHNGTVRSILGAEIMYSVQRLATGWTVWGSNFGGG